MKEVVVRRDDRAAASQRELGGDARASVRDFHLTMGIGAPSEPIDLQSYPGDLRCALIAEEVEELALAFEHADLPMAIDALCDILYVAYGAAVAMGEDLGRDHPPGGSGPASGSPTLRSADVERLRMRSREFADAWTARERGPMLQALSSLVDDAYLAAAHLRLDIRPFFDRVHESNMAKRGGPMRADGKVEKPAGWRPPDIAGLYRALYGEPQMIALRGA